jgi:uncharacterized protein YbaP (TraB family)
MNIAGDDGALRRSPMRRWLLACKGALLALVLGSQAAPARAEPPMWVVKDQDSTIYLFGTAHLLDPAIQWRTERVLKALDEAKQLWVEIAIPPGGEIELATKMMQKALSPGQPLSSRLTEAERARLRELLARSPDGAAIGMVVEMAKPWLATVMLGVVPLMAVGYEAEAGADAVLTQLAREQGDEIRGLETAEQQLDLLAGGTDAEQLAALKELLATPDAEFEAMTKTMDAGMRAWMKGDAKPLTEYVERWRKGEGGATSGSMSYELMLVRRNENWAQQLETLLKGSGVAFVAVGGGHLVGRDNLQAKLAARGIKVSVY